MFWARHKKLLMMASMLFVTLTFFCVPASAQCPLCRLAVENSSQAALMSRGLNLAIVVLLIPPVTIFCSIFFLAFKYRKIRRA
jgi:hypothetical protein